MKRAMKAAISTALGSLFLAQFQAGVLQACSTFKLQKGNELLYGHNLNQPGMDVPAQIFINKRGVFKIGRSGCAIGKIEVLNMDQKQGGDVASLFHAATDREIREFIAVLPIPDDFFTQGGITKEDFVERFATHFHAAEDPARQFFKGTWKTKPEEGTKSSDSTGMTVELKVAGRAVTGEISNAEGEKYPIDHVHLVNSDLSFTFRNQGGTVLIVRAVLDKGRMDFELWGIEDLMGGFTLYRQ